MEIWDIISSWSKEWYYKWLPEICAILEVSFILHLRLENNSVLSIHRHLQKFLFYDLVFKLCISHVLPVLVLYISSQMSFKLKCFRLYAARYNCEVKTAGFYGCRIYIWFWFLKNLCQVFDPVTLFLETLSYINNQKKR